MEKLFITGGSGLLGSNLAKVAVGKFQVYATYNRHEVSMPGVEFLKMDLSNEAELAKIEDIKPKYIINCAALTNIDLCEKDKSESYKQNVLIAVHMAKIAQKTGAYLVHLSTDAFFDGAGNCKEDEVARPNNVYAKDKLEAEKQVLSQCPSACVVRTNIYGWNKQDKFSLAEWMLNKLQTNQELPGFKDVYYTPIFVNDLAQALFRLLDIQPQGIIHVAGKESLSKLEFAHRLAKEFNLNEDLIKPVAVSDVKLTAPRGNNTSLDVSKAEEILGIKLPNASEGLKHMRALLENGYYKELKGE